MTATLTSATGEATTTIEEGAYLVTIGRNTLTADRWTTTTTSGHAHTHLVIRGAKGARHTFYATNTPGVYASNTLRHRGQQVWLKAAGDMLTAHTVRPA